MKKKTLIIISVIIVLLVLCGVYLYYENTKSKTLTNSNL